MEGAETLPSPKQGFGANLYLRKHRKRRMKFIPQLSDFKMDGRHDWIRTSDLFRVKASINCTFNHLRRKGQTYRGVARLFQERLGLSVAPSTLHSFVKVRAKHRKRTQFELPPVEVTAASQLPPAIVLPPSRLGHLSSHEKLAGLCSVRTSL